jgi:hypothetical protein
MLVSANTGNWRGPIAIFQPVGGEVATSLVARDIKTVSWLAELVGAVLWSDDGEIEAHASIVAALTTRDDVTISSPAGQLAGAWNRPLPPRELTLWATSDDPTDDEMTLRPLFIGDRRAVDEPDIISRRIDLV